MTSEDRAFILCLVGGLAMSLSLGWTIRGDTDHAKEPSAEVIALRSQVASLEAALYRAEREACPNLGVVEVPPPAKKAGRK